MTLFLVYIIPVWLPLPMKDILQIECNKFCFIRFYFAERSSEIAVPPTLHVTFRWDLIISNNQVIVSY